MNDLSFEWGNYEVREDMLTVYLEEKRFNDFYYVFSNQVGRVQQLRTWQQMY
jgi:hypothetical protein